MRHRLTAAGTLLWMVLAAVAVSPAAQADAACPAGQPCIVVRDHGPGGQTFVVDLATLDQIGDVTQQQYRTYTGRGAPRDEPFVAKGASITAVLAHFSLTATRVTAQSGPAAHQTQLDQGDLGTGYLDGLTPAFFSDSPSFIRFVRPMHDAQDANYQDYWSSESNAVVYLDVYASGHVLHPVIRPSRSSAPAGTPVSFAVSLAGGPPAGATYAWDFGDGTSSAAAAPRHAWRRAGSSFSVGLTVSSADGSVGTASPVTIRVGKAPKKKPGRQPGTGSAGAHNPVTGPATGDGHHAGGSTTGTGTSSTGTPTASPAPSPPPAPTPTPRPARKPRPRAVAGDRVEGVLLVGAASVQAPAQASPPSSRRAAAARADGADAGRQLWWLLVLPVVLGLGALGQSRWWWRRRPTAPWTISG